jgi:predicted ribosome quality control (RQC) complex YloA/Tae2 family protein
MTIHSPNEGIILWIRLWGGAGNIVVTDSAYRILDAFYRRPNRGEISGEYFNPEEELKTQSLEQAAAKDSYSVRDLDLENGTSFNEKIENHYFGKTARREIETIRNQVKTLLTQRETKTISKLDVLSTQLQKDDEIELFKQWGDLIMSNLHRISKGDTWLETQNYFGDGGTVVIQLDPDATPVQNAEQYYEKYKKGKSGRESLLKEIEIEKHKLDEVHKDRNKLTENPDDLFLCKSLLKKYGKSRHKMTSEEADKFPGAVYNSGDFTLYVGRTAKENDQLLRRYVKGNDYWLHARDYPGAYVFIKHIPGKSIPLETLLDAGNLALHFSKGKNTGTADLYYTQVKYLRRTKHGKMGLVIPTQEKNLTITPDDQRIKKLKEQNS